MSRLIFEGNTAKRFGEKFPKPFIEQVRVQDSGEGVAFEVDIAFYFKVPNEQEKVDAFNNLSKQFIKLKNVRKLAGYKSFICKKIL